MADSTSSTTATSTGWFGGGGAGIWPLTTTATNSPSADPAAMSTGNSIVETLDDYSEMDINDDEIADRLLTQFPPYGSSSQASTAQDWFGVSVAVPGTTTTTTTETANNYGGAYEQDNLESVDLQQQSRHQHPQQHQSGGGRGGAAGNKQETNHNSNNSNGIAVTAANPNDDWDLDEQNLWGKGGSSKIVYNNSNNNDIKDNTHKSSTMNRNKKRKNQLHHQHHQHTNNKNIHQEGGEDRRRQEWVLGESSAAAAAAASADGTTSKSIAISSTTTSSSSRPSLLLSRHYQRDGSRQHWMPDQLCKQCYACDIPFTVFRRRHHCRLCGQVFCNACSAYFVRQGGQKSNMTIRVCQMCNDQVAQKGGLAVLDETAGIPVRPVISPNDKKDPSTSTATAATTTTTATTNPTTTPTSSPDHHHDAASRKRRHLLSDHVLVDANNAATNAMISNSSSNHNPDDNSNSVTASAAAAGGGAGVGPGGSNTSNNSTAVFNALSQSKRLILTTTVAAAAATPVTPQQVQDLEEQERLQLQQIEQEEHLLHPHHHVPPPTPPSLKRTVSNESTGAPTLPSTTEADAREQRRQGKIHLGMTAANHLEEIAGELLKSHAPLLLQKKKLTQQQRNNQEGARPINNKEKVDKGEENNSSTTTTREKEDDKEKDDVSADVDEIETRRIKQLKANWIDQLLTLSTRCCSTVNPNVKMGDLLDIRPYVKVKTVPGGSYRDCAYLSGIMFRKTVSHKRMAKQIDNPRILLLSGGIEFTRTENRIASLETLFEQEEKYIEILISKILKLKPDVLLVGRTVSRRGQELLLKAGVVLIQHVKSSLLSRIARQTGATVISSTDHYMSQFGPDVLGKCRRFRLVTFRDNELWTDELLPEDKGTEENTDSNKGIRSSQQVHQKRRSIEAMLADPKLSIPERQAALAASKLGQGVLDGCEAVKTGLAKRGVAQTYVLLEGAPKHLGCTVVLRGAQRAALKELKVVFRFLVNVAYNLRLETSYLKERGARIRPDFQGGLKYAHSSSLCVDYGQPPNGKKTRPWNGGTTDKVPLLESGDVTAFDHQSILITSVWMTEKTQCCPAEVKGICYYSLQDVALGQFLRDSCFNLSLKCQNPNCKKSVLDHSLSFVHNDGLLNITVEELDEKLPPSPLESGSRGDDEEMNASKEDGDDADVDKPIATWTYCKNCRKVVTPLVYISENTWKYSFGKFLEVFFYNRDAIMNAPEHQCSCQVQSATRLYFGCGKLGARFNYEAIRPFNVFVRRNLPMETSFQKEEALRRLDLVTNASSKLFSKFDKHIERVAREARSLFNSPVNRPEHLQTVLLELKRIGSDVDHVAKTLQDKIATVTESYNRQQVDDDSINEALFQFPWFARRYLFMLTSAWNEKLSAAGQALSAMKRIAASSSSQNDGGVIGTNVSMAVGDPANDALIESMKRLRKLNETYARYSVTDITEVLPSLPGATDLQQDGDYDDEFDDPDTSIDFSEGIDADVLASRRRLQSKSAAQTSSQSATASAAAASHPRPTKSLGTRRNDGSRPSGQDSVGSNTSVNTTTTNTSAPQKTTAGGAVKSAITRFFNRGGREYDNYTVNLGVFAEGRPRLQPGLNGVVVAVYDEQLSTIIAYSLASVEYAKQFKHFSKHESTPAEGDSFSGPSTSQQRSRVSDSSGPSANDNDTRQRPAEPPGASSAGPPGSGPSTTQNNQARAGGAGSDVDEMKDIERRMLVRSKSHIKHTFREFDEKGQVTCKFVCTTYWATQFNAVRQVFLSRSGQPSNSSSSDRDPNEVEQGYVESLSSAYLWDASGGKSGASFARTSDDRFVIKCISRTELQMFLDCAPAYFEYLSKAFFHGLPTVLCKIVGVYQIGVHNRVTGKRSMEQVAVMQNIFFGRNTKITRVFDLKGSLRGRFAAHIQQSAKESAKDESSDTPLQTSDASNGEKSKKPDAPASSDDATNRDTEDTADQSSSNKDAMSEEDRSAEEEAGPKTLLDGDFLEFTSGRPMPMTDRAKAVFQMSILNDTLFLSIINVLDYSILVGLDEDTHELVVGIIDFMRQYDILKQMERVGKSIPMVVGSEAPTIIQPPLYKARFTNAMERYFMTVPSKWTTV